jgi:exopolysaccharide production protein ExoQ
VLIVKLSGAWYHPSFTPSDTAPGLALINGLFLAFCLYGSLRLLFHNAIAAVFAEPAYLAVLILGALGAILSVSPSNSLGMVRTATLFFGACIFLRYRFTPGYLLQLFAAVMGAMMLLSLLAAMATPIGVMPGFDAGRWRGVFNHKNTLGEGAAITLLVSAGLYLTQTRSRYWLLSTSAISCLCLLMSGSATALAAAALGMVLMLTALFIVRLRVRRHQGFWLLLGLIVALAAGAYAGAEFMATSLGRDMTFTGRTDIWMQFLHFAQQRPWTGWGWATISTTDHMLPLIRQTLGLPNIQTPHSGYLSLLVELGIPGLLAFITWLACTLVSASRRAILGCEGPAMIRLAVVIALIVHSGFESTSGALPSLWLLLLFAANARIWIRWN